MDEIKISEVKADEKQQKFYKDVIKFLQEGHLEAIKYLEKIGMNYSHIHHYL